MLTFFVLTTILFAVVSAYFAFRYDRKIHDNVAKQKEISRHAFELALLSDITQKVGYSLNIESVAETIALTVENLFDLSTVSYALKSRDTLVIKTYRKENIGLTYVQTVSKTMVSALSVIDPDFGKLKIAEVQGQSVTELNRESYFDTVPQSYFNIPLVINNELVGMINISSRKKGIYQEQDMTLLYKLVNTAQTTISKLSNVIETEKGKLSSMILSLPSGAVLFGLEKEGINISVINHAAKTFLEIDEKENQIDVAEVISKFPPALKIVDNIKAVIAEKKSVILKEVAVGGKTFTIYITPTFAFGTDTIVGVSLTMRDMTLEQQIEKVRTDFTNMIVHDLRAPASAIRGASNMLSSGALTREDAQKMVRVISDSSNKLLTRISDILDVGRLEEGKLKIRKIMSDFTEFVKQNVEVFSYAAREKNINVLFEAEENIPKFMFDAERIGQVINNLISNSLKFTYNGGKIEVKIYLRQGHIEVYVADSGLGIPSDQKPFLFTKFGRIRQGLGAGQSSGLGLYISKEIIEAHGGKIWVESPVKGADGLEHQGTKVYFSLPLEIEEKMQASSGQEYAN